MESFQTLAVEQRNIALCLAFSSVCYDNPNDYMTAITHSITWLTLPQHLLLSGTAHEGKQQVAWTLAV